MEHPLIKDYSRFSNKKVGVLGGSFDPVHLGHLAIAKACLKERFLDAIIFIPAAQNPKKIQASHFSPKERLEMLSLALEDQEDFFLSRIELDRKRLSYSIDTVKDLKKLAPSIQIFWIMGSDNLFDQEGKETSIKHWHNSKEFLSQVELLIIFRDSSNGPKEQEFLNHLAKDYSEQELARFKNALVNIQALDISSTEVRQALKNRQLKNLPLDPKVKEYILSKIEKDC